MSSRTTVSIYNAQVTTQLRTESCCACGIVFGMPLDFYKECQSNTERWFFCPNGHRQHYTESEETRLRRQLENERDNVAYWRSQQALTEGSLRATKGHLTRLRKRAEAGVCIHCNRTFQNVARHMESQHGGEA